MRSFEGQTEYYNHWHERGLPSRRLFMDLDLDLIIYGLTILIHLQNRLNVI